MVRRFGVAEKQHAVFTKRDEQILRVPLCAQPAADLQQCWILIRAARSARLRQPALEKASERFGFITVT
jgi:hypothetical protein